MLTFQNSVANGGGLNSPHTIQCETKLILKPFEKVLLPIAEITNQESNDKKEIWDYIYEPSSKEILDGLLKRYIETQIFQAVIENNACQQAAKMIAMKNASENAEEIIIGLQLVYNNARQASITQELSEIVAGAAAV